MYEKEPKQNPEIATALDDVAICRHESCECDMVYPIEWEQDDDYWDITLRCPNCDDVRPVKMNEELLEKFDYKLDRGTDSLVFDLRNLTFANMTTYTNAFVYALDNDHILPEDF